VFLGFLTGSFDAIFDRGDAFVVDEFISAFNLDRGNVSDWD
jgi:hypothetical protein